MADLFRVIPELFRAILSYSDLFREGNDRMKKSRMILALAVAFLLGVGISQLALNLIDLPTQNSNQNRGTEIDQKIFEQSFQREIDSLDRNWQQYHTTLENFKEGSIDLQTATETFESILEDQKQIVDRIDRLIPPDEISSTRLQKMIDYSHEQLETINQTHQASEEMLSHPELEHEIQSKTLQDIMIRNSPAGLFILGAQ